MAAPGWFQGIEGGRLAKYAGRFLMLVALAFIGREAHRHWADLSAWTPRPAQLVTVAGLAIAYGLALYLLVENWHRIVGLFAPETRARTYPSYTMTQIAKYLPGNIVHLLGRAAWLRGGGLSNRQLGQATLLEMAVVPAGAGLFLLLACLVVPLTALVPALAPAQPYVVPLAAALALAAL
uniref:hypothetical protein n=1 Tax=Sandarakinorhabdus rubra TaxID=2672568 RepID=UPI001969D9DF